MDEEQQLEFDAVLYKLHTELKTLIDIGQGALPNDTLLLASKLMKDSEK